jgi:hypothetical protein
VVKAEGVSGVVYKVRKVIQVWWGGAGSLAALCKVGKCQAEPGFGPTPPLQ